MSETSVAPRGGFRHALDALRAGDFRRWFLSQLLSSSGSSTQSVGQAWLVVQLHGGGLALGVVTASIFLPTLLLGAPFGALADRWDRRKLLVITQCLQIAIAGTLSALTLAGLASIPLLVGFALGMGTVFALDAPARQVYVLELVGGDRLASAISLNEVMLNASRVLGPALGGAILAVGSVWMCFGVNALSFVPTLVVLLGQRERLYPATPRRTERGHLRAGFGYALASAPIRACLLMAVTAGAVYNIAVIMPLMATRVFHVGGGDYGLMLAAFGVGAVPGALLSAAGSPTPSGRAVRALGLTTGAVVVACAYAPTLWTLLVLIAAVGAVSIWFIARANAFVLLATDPGLRGRVMGVWSMALPGMNPATGIAAGAAAGAFGPRTAYAGVGVGAMVAALAGWRALRPGPARARSAATGPGGRR